MNDNQIHRLGGLILILSLVFAGCSKGKTEISELTDDPVIVPMTVKDLPETVPAYGIVTSGVLEVNVEKEDSSKVLVGQKATALVGLGQSSVKCSVVNILRNVNTTTGLAIAWLKPTQDASLTDGDFVSAKIILKIKHHVATIPQQAIFIREGKTLVIVRQTEKDSEVQYEPVQVQIGIVSDSDVEILSGLKPQDEVVVQAGIGYLYPEFKSQAGD